jgi:pilus assembly protein Flp/PilA
MLTLYTYMYTFMDSRLTRLREDDRGATAVEYGLLVALIAGVIVVAVTALGTKVSGLFTTITTNI